MKVFFVFMKQINIYENNILHLSNLHCATQFINSNNSNSNCNHDWLLDRKSTLLGVLSR